MDYNKVEDAVFKKAMEVFKDGAAEFFNLDVKIIAPAETEIKNIDIKTNAMIIYFIQMMINIYILNFKPQKRKMIYQDFSIMIHRCITRVRKR